MTTAVQRRRGTTTEHATFTGLEGEISVNTTKDTLVVHDGSTAGGFELMRADGSNSSVSLGDITGVTAGTGLSGGGTSGDVTLNIDSTVTTLDGTQTLTNKTLTSPTLNTPTIGTSFTIGGATITEAELEILDGATVTTTELNYVDGVTSSIQTQIDAKAPLASPTFTGTATFADVDINAGSIDGTAIGASSASTGAFTTLTATGLTVDTNTLYVDSTNNRVGIGTSSPSNDLHVSSTTGSARLTSTGGGANLYMESANGNTTRIRWNSNTNFAIRNDATSSDVFNIDQSGNLLVGKTSTGTTTAGSQLNADGLLTATRNGNYASILTRLNSDGQILQFRKDGSTVGTIGSVLPISTRYFYISGTLSGVGFYSNGIYPSNSTGNFADNSKDLGSSSVRWDDVYATNGTIQTSDRNEKQDIAELSDAEQRVAVACKGLLRKFRWKDSVAEKGDDARIHFGIIAQDLQAAFEAEGLDAGDYAMFISTTWTDEETNEEKTRMGVRYSELLAFIISAI